MDADEVLGGGGGGGVRGGGVRVHGERQAAVRGLDLPRAGARAEAEDVVEGGAGRCVVRRGDGGGGGEGRGEGRRRVEARGGRRRRGRGAGTEGEEAGGQRGARGDHAGAWRWTGGAVERRDRKGGSGIGRAAEPCENEDSERQRRVGSLQALPPFYLLALAFRSGLWPVGAATSQRSLWAARIGCCATR